MRSIALLVVLPLALGLRLAAGEAAPVPAPGAGMEFGPVMSYFFELPGADGKKQFIAKGLCVRLGDGVSVGYDLETMRFAAAWTGGFLDMGTTNLVRTSQGTGPAPIAGKLQIATRTGMGWGRHGSFADPRTDGMGNLPGDWVRYRGLYRHGEQGVLAYSVGDCEVRELPGTFVAQGTTVFTRTLRLGKTVGAQQLLVCEVEGAGGGITTRAAPGLPSSTPAGQVGPADSALAVLDHAIGDDQGITVVGVSGAPPGAKLTVAGGQIVLTIVAQTVPGTCVVTIASGARTTLAAIAKAFTSVPAAVDVERLCQGGPARWSTPLTVAGTLGDGATAYTLDTIPMPTANPWHSWMRPSGLDFFADGRIALCTFGGDVWIVSGVDASLAQVRWRRYASGLFEPMGLRVVDDVVYVLCRDQITRLSDLNADGEADFYESFNHDGTILPRYNDYAFDLQTDRAGNFYYAKGGHNQPPGLPVHSCLCKVSKDGGKLEAVATGFRAPNGMGIGPQDEITVGDNQGNWIPSSKISLIKPGGWYGFVGDPKHYGKNPPKAPAESEPPLCWIPMAVDNSSGGQVWATSGHWGPLAGHLLHFSYGQSTVMTVLYEKTGGVAQGGVVPFPFRFASGVMRGRFSPTDGQLYACGLKGWQTNAGVDGCLQRMRYTGKPANVPVHLHVAANGIEIGFSDALDRDSAAVDGVAIEQWNYRWASDYGSPDLSPADPTKKGRDPVEVKSVTLSPDGRTLFLAIDGLKPVMQMAIKLKLKAADGAAISQSIYQTINVVPK